MRGLKILVAAMGVMILAGVTLLIVAIADRLSHPPAAASPTAPFDLPAGARIESLGVGANRLAVAILLPGGDRRIVIIDLATGRQLETVPLRIAP